MDHAAKVEKKKQHLMAAGINEVDASKVAQELAEKTAGGDNGGPDGSVLANGQGRRSQEVDARGMYGSQFRTASGNVQPMSRGSDSSDNTYVQRPTAVTTASQLGRFAHLGQAGGRESLTSARLESPAMATNDELYAPLAAGGDMPLGGMVNDQPRYRFARTDSSGV